MPFLLHLLLLFTIFSSILTFVSTDGKLLVSLDDIALLVDCHDKFTQLRGHQMSNGDLYEMDPFFRIDAHFHDCLHKIKADNNGQTAMATLHDRIFAISGFDEWFSAEKQRLVGERKDIEQKSEGKEKYEKLEEWRKKVFSLGMAREMGYQLIGAFLMDSHFLGHVGDMAKLNVKKYERMRKQLEAAASNSELMLRDGDPKITDGQQEGAKKTRLRCFGYRKFQGIKDKLVAKMEGEVGLNLEMPVEFGEHWWTDDPPKMKRIIWVVRHAERYDNIKSELKEKSKAHKVYDEDRRLFWWDNSPLSPRGKERQAPKLAEFFKNIPIKHIFASPLERTVDTASRLLSSNHGNLTIKLEPGFIERLDQCVSPDPSYQSCAELVAAGYSRLDCDYRSLYRKMGESGGNEPEFSGLYKEQLILESDKEGIDHNENDVLGRVETVLNYVLENFGDRECRAEKDRDADQNPTNGQKLISPAEGEEEDAAEHIVIVSHGAVTGAIHQLVVGHWAYVAQASLSKFVEFEGNWAKESPGMARLHRMFTSETKHLGKEREHDLRFC